MTEFLAVFRMNGGSLPSKTSYKADSVNAAINRLMSAANVASTMEFAEYEIMEVIDAGKGYKIVAAKYANASPSVSKALVVVPEETKVYTESPWVPHEIGVA